jgi:hypothetical protein
VLGVRHHADHVAAPVAYAGDAPSRPVRIERVEHLTPGRAVPQDHLSVRLQAVQVGLGGDELALAVLDRDLDHLAVRPAGEAPGRILDAQGHPPADERERPVPDQRAREQPRLAQDLEAIADPQHRAAVLGERPNRRHHRGEPSDRARS